MAKYGLIGYPLGHSLSPVIHKQLMSISGTVGEYSLMETPSGKFKSIRNELLTLDGFNITIPYKQDIVPMLDSMSHKAKLFGAVNTVKCENGKMTGFNTDCFGFTLSAKSAGLSIDGKVLLCGAGGVSRMFAFECASAGASLTISARNKDKAQIIADEIKAKLNKTVIATDLKEVNADFDLVINATPVGMYPNVSDCVLSPRQIERCASVFDAIYNPYETVLIKKAKANGAKCTNGLMMLVWQAAVAQEIWTGFSFNDSQIKEITEYVGAKERII